MRLYTDPVGGVSFRYPSVWTTSKAADTFFPSVIAPGGEPLLAVFSFSPNGNYYEHTGLTGLQFLYRRQESATEAACESLLTSARGNTQPVEHLAIDGVGFAHLNAGYAGMVRTRSQQAYSAWRGGTCYLFEADMSLIAEGADPGKTRDLSATETRALRRHLNEIVESIRFKVP